MLQLRSVLSGSGLISAVHSGGPSVRQVPCRPCYTQIAQCHPCHARLPLKSRLLSSATNGSDVAGSDDEQPGSAGPVAEASGDMPPGWEEVEGAGRILTYELHREASESYLAYAMSVIVGRALPDVRDGLKPVHRRILFAMHDLGMAANKPFRKCARVVGEVLGKYHPHGDTAVYDALVRLAQDFSMRAPLIDGHGNFGSLDNDPAAAMRYTECRLHNLTSAALLMDLESDTIEFAPNFDGSQVEPTVLPARIPNLLVNGASGIAVGIATKIPPHNMGEVVAGLKALIRQPGISSAELVARHIPGPDFPTGGCLLAGSGLGDAYTTGRGSVTLRGLVTIEEPGGVGAPGGGDRRGGRKRRGPTSDRPLIVITEIPYQTSKADLVECIARLVDERVLEGISDVRDESDREGIRVVVEVKRGASAELVLNQLYHHTRLQVRFSCNMVALVDGQPKTLSLRDFLELFLEWRCEVIRRRSKFAALKAQARLHLVEGYTAILQDVDKAIRLIRAADDSAGAGAALAKEFGLTAEQTKGVLNMTLGRLTGMEAKKLEAELVELKEKIRDLNDLVENRQRLLGVVEEEADEVVQRFGTPRRTLLQSDNGQGVLSAEDILPNEPSFITFSKRGYIKRMKATTFQVQGRGGKGVSGTRLRSDDSMENVVHVMDHDHMLFFSDRGVVYSVRAYEVPEAQRTAQGTPISSVLDIPKNGSITAVQATAEFPEGESLIMATKGGLIKRVELSDFAKVRANGLNAMKLKDNDSLSFVEKCHKPGSSVLVACNTGRLAHFSADCLRPTSRTAQGVKSMNLKAGEHVVGMSILPPELEFTEDGSTDDESETGEDVIEESPADPVNASPWVLLITKKGLGKRVGVRQFSKTRRGALGVRGLRLRDGDSLAYMSVVGVNAPCEPSESCGDVVVASREGLVQRNAIANISLQSRSSRGVAVMRLQDDDEVTSATTIPPTDDTDN